MQKAGTASCKSAPPAPVLAQGVVCEGTGNVSAAELRQLWGCPAGAELPGGRCVPQGSGERLPGPVGAQGTGPARRWPRGVPRAPGPGGRGGWWHSGTVRPPGSRRESQRKPRKRCTWAVARRRSALPGWQPRPGHRLGRARAGPWGPKTPTK